MFMKQIIICKKIELLIKEVKKDYLKENPRVIESILFQK